MASVRRDHRWAPWTDALASSKVLPIVIIVALCAVSLAQAPLLLYDDLNLEYPFMFPDSYDWIANGLHYAGFPVNFSLRPPGLPLIMAALARVGALHLLPLLNLAVALGIVALCYRLVRPGVSRAAATLSVVLLYAGYFFHTLAFYVLADLYCLLFMMLSLREYLRAEGSPGRYITSALYLGVSLAFQYAGLVLLPAYALVWLLRRRRQPAWRHLAGAAAVLAATLAPWMVYRWIAFGDPLYSKVLNDELVRWHTDSIPFYLYNAVGATGISACVLALIGLMVAVRRGLNDELLVMLLVLAGNILFWVFLYDWNDRRFVLYWLLPIYYLVARGTHAILTALPAFRWRWAAASAVMALLALQANLDPGSPLSVDRIALTPQIGVVAPAIGWGRGGDIDLGALRVERVERRPVSALAATKPLQVWLQRPGAPGTSEVAQARALLAARYPGGYSPLYFRSTAESADSWYVLRNRYGNAFLTTLKPVTSLAEVPPGKPVLMLKPFDRNDTVMCELLWEGSDAILLVTGGEQGAATISDGVPGAISAWRKRTL